MSDDYLHVVVDNNTDATDMLYSYACSKGEAQIGDKVDITFGRSNRKTAGYVAGVSNEAPEGVENIKRIISCSPNEGLTAEAMRTALWMRRRYLCRYIEAVKCFLPANTTAKRKTKDPFEGIEAAPSDPEVLNPDQQKALDEIAKALDARENENFLLFGVTGSGKTEVYLQAMARCFEQGRQGIILVPEISLTPQAISRFMSRFGKESIAILHSRLTRAQKSVEYEKIRLGKVKLVIGARSAIFAPLQDIGLIVIDEEHESSYKSDMSPKYEAMEVAMKRAKDHSAVMVLGSATPSICDYYRSKYGIFTRLELPERYNRTPLPEVEIVDMRREVKAGNRSLFSEMLAASISDCLERKKQIILFLNRRGYSPFVSCRECGYVPTCPECGISMTYHKAKRALLCHYCGRSRPFPKVCPECGSSLIGKFGAGTEQVEERVRELFPQARTDRLDADTTRRKGQLEGILRRFERGKTDILIGTQLVAKGLDVANVALVGIISADVSLNIPDYRSGERTFQLITQAAGRAGRGGEQGMVYVQTYSPDAAVIQSAAQQDYKAFYEREIEIRKAVFYPPFADIFLFVCSDEEELKAMDSAARSAQWFRGRLPKECIVIGPYASPLAKQSGRYRYQLLVKAPAGYRQMCSMAAFELRAEFNKSKSTAKLLTMDINPSSFI